MNLPLVTFALNLGSWQELAGVSDCLAGSSI